MSCNKKHINILDENKLTTLSDHQMQKHGRHKCCQCAYNSGYQQGFELQESISLDINALGDTQARSDGRHKSVHQAFSLGYSHGIQDYIEQHN